MGVQREVRVALDVQRTAFEPRAEVVVRQYDKGARFLIDVLDGGAPLAAEGLEAHLMCDTRGGLVQATLVRSGGVWEYTLGSDLTAFPGELSPYVEMRRGGEVVAATGSFRLRVDRAADLTAGQAKAAQSRLDEAVGAWREFQAQAEAQESARSEAEAKRAAAEEGRAEAERARGEAEADRAREWASASLSIGEVTEADPPSASVRRGPGGALDLVLDLGLARGPRGRDGAAVVDELTEPEVDALFDGQAGGDPGGGGTGAGGFVAMGDSEVDEMFEGAGA